MSRKVNDEKILEVLMRTGSVRDAAAELGYTRQALYNRIKEPDFSAMYCAAKDDAIKAASAHLTKHMVKAIETIAKIMQDDDTSPQTRANCALYVLQYGLRYYEFSDITERLERLEEAQPEGVIQR